MIQRGERGLLAGLWDLPTLSLDESLSAARRNDPPGALADYLFGRLEVRAKTGERVARLTHVFTHRRLTLEVHRVTLRRALPDDVDGAVRWVRPSELPRLPLSRLAVRALTASGIAIPPDAASRSRLR